MPESALNVSASRADNSSVGRIETEAYLPANKSPDATVKRMVKVRADPTDGTSKIGAAETTVSGDAATTVTNLKPVKSSIVRNPLTEKQSRGNFVGDVTETEEVSYFITGSSYKGSWDALGMAGVGRYVMPHGTAYEGEIRDGMFHGQGSLYWPKKNRLDTVHLRGKLRGHRYTFEDGLVYQDEDWSYCKFPDRRFYESIKKGLRPGGRTLKTAKQPTKVLPSGCYDAGDGAFDPKTMRITSYDNAEKVLRIPTKEESDWIVKNCRKSWTEPTGYRPSLNENWSEDPPELPYHIAMSEDSPDPWWKRLTTFNRQSEPARAEDDEDICNRAQHEDISVPEICLCGRYVILGEPCHCAAVATPLDDEDETEEMNDGLQSVSHSSDLDVKRAVTREKRKSIRIIDQGSSRVDESSAEVPECAETSTNDSRRNQETDVKREYTMEEKNRKEEEEFMQTSGAKKNREEEAGKESVMMMQVENQENIDEERGEEDDRLHASAEEIVERRRSVEMEENRRIVGKESNDAEFDGSKDQLDELLPVKVVNEGRKVKDLRRPPPEDHDHAVASVRREKAPIVTEPETSNGRRMESEGSTLLPKGETSEGDLPYDRTGEKASPSTVIDDSAIRESPMASGGTTSNDSQSRDTDEEMATEGSSVLSENDLPILEKLHRSLAVLSPGKQKPTAEKEIIEIYSKFSRKEKSKGVKCGQVNVWRLSGAAQDGPQTKMEDPLVHPILAVPRCELIECMGKPRAVSVCKPRVPEVRTSASRCRKEFPFDIPSKHSRSSAERTGCRNKLQKIDNL